MPIVEDLRFLLNIVLERSAEEIDLKDMGFGMHIATLSSQRIQSFSSFVLAVSAQLPSDMLQKQVLQQVKVASSDMIQTIITSSLPGIPLKWMAVAPRQIPFHAGVMYFEITKEFEYQSLWDRVSGSGSMSIHASGDFPELRFVLWGLR
jgi:type VI secretion system protein ImpJ